MDTPIQDEITMDQVMASMDNEQEIRQGKPVEGYVVRIDKDGIMVDIGGKSEAKIPVDQLSAKEAEDLEGSFKVGEKIKARVLVPSGKDGIILSKKSLDYELRWDDIKKLYESKEVFKAVVKEANKGGLRVDLLGYPAFCPNSQVWERPEKKKYIIDGNEVELQIHEKLIGETLEFRIKEIDEKEHHKIILTNREVVKEQRDKAKEAFWKGIFEGQTREGEVKSIQSYGAFVTLADGFDGMLHISEMSWNKITSPKEILKEKDKIQVYVLKLDKEKGRISLSLKQIQEDPWNNIPGKYPLNTVFNGKITRVAKKAAFVDLGDGVEGIIPISEMSVTRINECSDVVKPGDMVDVKVIQIVDKERKITLSMKKIEQEKIDVQEAKELEEYQKEQEANASFNLGDIIPEELKANLLK